MIQVNWDENCRACGGNGFQHNQLTGMNETCPVCKDLGMLGEDIRMACIVEEIK